MGSISSGLRNKGQCRIPKQVVTLSQIDAHAVEYGRKSSASMILGQSDLTTDEQYIRRNILVEFVPNTLADQIVSFLQKSPVASNRESDDRYDEMFSFPLNIWIERESSRWDQPSLIITIGSPGSGKITWATSRYRHVYAVDDYFTEKKLDFAFRHLQSAHSWCQEKVFQALRKWESVCVGNTNTTLKAMFPYVAAVVFGKLPHKIVFVRMPFFDSEVLHRRTLHDVPEHVIVKMTDQIRSIGVPTISRVLKAGPFPEKRTKSSSFVCFLAIFLCEDSVTRLREIVRKHSQEGLLEDLKDCHVTIKFMPTQEEVLQAELGREVEVQVKNIFSNEWCQCVSVSVNEKYGLAINAKHPHITVACKQGISPVISNYVVEHSRIGRESGQLMLKGRIGAYLNRTAVNSLEILLATQTTLGELSEENKTSKIVWSQEGLSELRKQIENHKTKTMAQPAETAEASGKVVDL
jgi:predicted kinase